MACRIEEPRIEFLRRCIEEQYRNRRLGSGVIGRCFGAILCHELHLAKEPRPAGLHFKALAEKRGVSLPTVGELISDDCKRLEELPRVAHD